MGDGCDVVDGCYLSRVGRWCLDVIIVMYNTRSTYMYYPGIIWLVAGAVGIHPDNICECVGVSLGSRRE